MSTQNYITVRAAARLVGRCPETLRLWDKEGAVVPARTSSGIRLYSAEDVDKLREVAASKQRGRPPKNRGTTR